MRFLYATVLLLAACATGSPRPYPIYVRGLFPERHAEKIDPGVVVIASAITWGNWLDHREILDHLVWTVNSTSGPRDASGAGTQALVQNAARTAEVRYDDLPLMPLPAFWLELQNETEQPVSFAHARILLDDGNGHQYPALPDREAVERAIVAAVVERHPELESQLQVPVVEGLRQKVAQLPFWQASDVVAPHQARAAYVSFQLTAAEASEFARTVAGLKQLTLRLSGLESPSGRVADVSYAFTVLRRPSNVTCADGTHVAHASLCKVPSELPTQPITGGPCIQKTHVAHTNWGTQWWAGATPIANSDLERMLLASPTTRRHAKRSIALRWSGYGVVALSLIGAVTVAGAVQTSHPGYGLYGLTPLGLLPVGFGLVWKAEKENEAAIAAYNAEDEETGTCAPVW